MVVIENGEQAPIRELRRQPGKFLTMQLLNDESLKSIIDKVICDAECYEKAEHKVELMDICRLKCYRLRSICAC